jgi:hypothetical protein
MTSQIVSFREDQGRRYLKYKKSNGKWFLKCSMRVPDEHGNLHECNMEEIREDHFKEKLKKKSAS